ncbi:MAG: hypothetical protein PHC34_09470 [Candidatus Gastranaerophilales bacterium]|nr:hypothetical protein [Candidatus Gastranaerophilales bacterium]
MNLLAISLFHLVYINKVKKMFYCGMKINNLKKCINDSYLGQEVKKPASSVSSADNCIKNISLADKSLNSDLLKAYYGISFCGSPIKVLSSEDFLNKFTDLFCSPKDLIKKTLQYSRPIGAGGEGSVYNIPDVDNYLLKVPNFYSVSDVKDMNLNSFSPIKYNLEDINVGQPFLEIGHVKILYKVNGENFNLNGNISDEIAYKRRLRMAASMPQEAYDNLAKLAVRLNDLGHSIDPGIENVLVERGKSFNPIDIYFDNKVKTTFTSILELLAGNDMYTREFGDFDDTKYLKTVINKCIKSCQKEDILLICPEKKSVGYKSDTEYLKTMLNYAGIKVKISDLKKHYSKTKDFQDFEAYINESFK